MKKWLCKYETYNGNVFTVEITGCDRQHAISTLLNCKEIYWIKSLPKSPTAALQQKSVVDKDLDFAKWLEENTQVIYEDKITLYRYFDNNEWGNYILEDIYKEYKEKH